MTVAQPKQVVLRRLAAVLASRGLTRCAFAARCGVSDPHLRGVLLGERHPSSRLLEAVEAELGAEALAFVRGETDTLRVPVAAIDGGAE